MHSDADFTLHRFQQREARRFPKFIRPSKVYSDPVYPDRAAIVILPFELEFRCEQVYWYGLTFAQRQGMIRDDRAGACAALLPATRSGTLTIPPILFIEDELKEIVGRWVCFVAEVLKGRVSRNLLKHYYETHPRPVLPPQSYAAAVINYDGGYIFADHPNLRKVFIP